uniref:Uncharacterized protein n=1 Tax=Tanacetum cinerariifolium TaxID=118510 RepID=A0A6L2LG76_TANCI|nr:hypothetical protein [Tanacetum cinerariifolium]
MDGWKPRALKNKSFAEIQELFDKAMTRINNFVDFRTKLMKESSKKVEESNSKRAVYELEQESAKKPRVCDDQEAAELWKYLEIVPDDEGNVTINATPLSSKSLTIVDYKIHKKGEKLFSNHQGISQQAATRNRGKSIINSPSLTYDQKPTMVVEDDEMSKEKKIDKLMALISLSFKKIYKPTKNNLKTSLNTSRAIQDNTLRINRGTGYDTQRVVNVVGARENVGTQEKDLTYHKENMLLCKQEEARFQLNAEQPDWRDDTNDKPDDQELEAHYMYMAQI